MAEDAIPRSQRHHDVFISYAQQDKPIADAVCAKLEAHNIRCWIAPRDVPPGQPFPEAIIEGIEGGKAVIVIFSSHANKSPHVIRELTNAVNKGRIIIPFRIEDVIPSKSMEYLISVPHWLDAVSPPLEKHIGVLITTLDAILGIDRAVVAPQEALPQPTEPTPPPPFPPVTEPPVPPPEPVRTPPAEPSEAEPPSAPSMAADEKPQAPAGTPGSWGKRIAALAGLVIVALIVILFVFSPGLLPIQQGGNNSSNITPNISHPGISDADYYQGTDAIVDTVVLTVAPTQVMVKNTELYVDADKDMSKVIVTVQFNGGPGTGLVRDNRVMLTRSDGTVTEGKLNFNQRLSTVQLQGSRGTDRIQVIIYLHSGESKTIIDKLLPYRKYH